MEKLKIIQVYLKPEEFREIRERAFLEEKSMSKLMLEAYRRSKQKDS